MSLSVIIPCKNEEKNILLTINKLKKILLKNKIDYEIILINDFSTDKTLNVIKKISKKNGKIKIFNNKISGLGGAINTGIRNASKIFSVIFMADLSDSPKDIIRYYLNIKNKNIDAVFGTRFSSKSKINNYPFSKLILNRLFNYLTKLLFLSDYNDFTNAFKMYKTNVLQKIKPIVSENFNIFLELPLKVISRNYKYKIISINWNNRKYGNTNFKIKELGSKYLFTLLYCFLEKVLLNNKKQK